MKINEIEKYLESIKVTKTENQVKFYGEKKELTKVEISKREAKRLINRIEQSKIGSESIISEIRKFFVILS